MRHWTKIGKQTNGLKNRKEDKTEEEVNDITLEDEESEDRLNFKCYICEESFNGRLKCLKHIQSCHSNEYETLQSKGAVDKVPTTQTRLMLDNHNEEYDAYGPEKVSYFMSLMISKFNDIFELRSIVYFVLDTLHYSIICAAICASIWVNVHFVALYVRKGFH